MGQLEQGKCGEKRIFQHNAPVPAFFPAQFEQNVFGHYYIMNLNAKKIQVFSPIVRRNVCQFQMHQQKINWHDPFFARILVALSQNLTQCTSTAKELLGKLERHH